MLFKLFLLDLIYFTHYNRAFNSQNFLVITPIFIWRSENVHVQLNSR